MIKNNIEYLNLIVPNEYRCIYYHILNVLGTLGEDLLSSCTATCKGKAINGLACYNMFLAACACYYLGQVKRARVLINYIKAQLEIDCNKTIIFEDSSNDEWIFVKVPSIYQCVFTKLLDKMSTWGQELLDDCTASCRGNNKNILNSWNLLQSAALAYEYGDTTKGNKIANYIKGLLGFNCPNEEDVVLEIKQLDTIIGDTECKVTGLVATCNNPSKFNSNGLSVYIKKGNNGYELIQSNIIPENSMNIGFDEIITYELTSDDLELTVKLSGTGKDNINYYTTFVKVIPGSSEEPADPAISDEPDDPDGPQPDDSDIAVEPYPTEPENAESEE